MAATATDRDLGLLPDERRCYMGGLRLMAQAIRSSVAFSYLRSNRDSKLPPASRQTIAADKIEVKTLDRLWDQRRYTISRTLPCNGPGRASDDADCERQRAAHRRKKDLAIRTSIMRRLERTTRNPPQRPDKNGVASPIPSARILRAARGWLRAPRSQVQTTPEIRERLQKKGASETHGEAWRWMNRETVESQKVSWEREEPLYPARKGMLTLKRKEQRRKASVRAKLERARFLVPDCEEAGLSGQATTEADTLDFAQSCSRTYGPGWTERPRAIAW